MKHLKIKFKKPGKPTKRQVHRFLVHTLIIAVGNALAAAASAFFIIPYGFVMGGTTGIGIFMRNILGGQNEWIVSLTVYIANISLFLLGAILLGKKFAVGTLAGTLLYPTFLSAFTAVNQLYVSSHGHPFAGEGDPMLAVFFGSLLFGLGIGLVVRIGASTGGTDIPPLILHKYLNLPVSVTLWALDMAIVLIQFFASVSLQMVLYGIVITIFSSFVIDLVSPFCTRISQFMIISKKYEDIREMILNGMNRGVTMLYGKTGFLRDKCYVLLTVISNRDVVKLKNEVEAIDPEAFIMVSVISEVRGRGFSSDKIVLPRASEGSESPKDAGGDGETSNE